MEKSISPVIAMITPGIMTLLVENRCIGVFGLVLPLLFEWRSGEGPPKRFGQGFVEILDERQNPFPHLFHRAKAAPIQQSTTQNPKPNLNLVQP